MAEEWTEAYTDFASVYDTFMDDTPYQEWADFLAELISTYGISKPHKNGEKALEAESSEKEKLETEKDLVVDLGCGTGTLTELLSRKGYDMIGVDMSAEMLNVALAKKEKSGSPILYLCQDMRELDLYSTVGTVISVCDSVNYLLEDEEVLETFGLVNNYLYPGGIFLFDFNTVYKYEQIIGDTTIAENREKCSFIWENYFYEDEMVNEYDLTLFIREESDLYRKYEELHYQKAYELEQVKELLLQAGMEFVAAYDAFTHDPVTAESERMYIIARPKRI